MMTIFINFQGFEIFNTDFMSKSQGFQSISDNSLKTI